jgi:hypothetical protein
MAATEWSGEMASKVEIEIDNVAPARLSKEELYGEMMMLWIAVTKLGQRHRVLQIEWDKRKMIESVLSLSKRHHRR